MSNSEFLDFTSCFYIFPVTDIAMRGTPVWSGVLYERDRGHQGLPTYPWLAAGNIWELGVSLMTLQIPRELGL